MTPLILLISSVPDISSRVPAIRKRRDIAIPWADHDVHAPRCMPKVFIEASPTPTMPMSVMLVYAIMPLYVGLASCTRSAEYTVEKRNMRNMYSAYCDAHRQYRGTSGTARSPPNFSRTPASIMLPVAGASVCASGSQPWSGKTGIFIMNETTRQHQDHELRRRGYAGSRDQALMSNVCGVTELYMQKYSDQQQKAGDDRVYYELYRSSIACRIRRK